MDKRELASHLEHTLLKPNAVISNSVLEKEISFVAENEISNIVLPPFYVEAAVNVVKKLNLDVCVCAVIGFPLGYCTKETKVFEMKEAIKFGATEIDLVLNNTLVAQERYSEILDEFKTFRSESNGVTLKMIIETSLLDEEKILKITEMLVEAKFDYVKTSTGFIGDGAQLSHVKAIKNRFKDEIKIKASGGIRTLADTEEFIKAGASRIGTSSAQIILNS